MGKMHRIAVAVAMAVLLTSDVVAATIACNHRVCAPGTRVVTTPDPKNDTVYYACRTGEISDYVDFNNTAIDLSAMAFAPPAFSPTTGDIVLEGDGQKKLDELRTKAGVKTWQEALDSCTKQTTAQTLTVVQLKPGVASLQTRDAQGHEAWIPKGFAKPLVGRSK